MLNILYGKIRWELIIIGIHILYYLNNFISLLIKAWHSRKISGEMFVCVFDLLYFEKSTHPAKNSSYIYLNGLASQPYMT